MTGRLVLRAPVLSDADDVARLANNTKIHAMTARLPYPYVRADAEHFITVVAGDAQERVWVIADRKTGELVGSISLKLKTGRPPELGYWLGEPYWGKGYATEAARAVIEWAGVPVIAARVIASNAASRAVLEKVGFLLVGETIDDCGPHEGAMVAQYRYEAL